MADSILEAFIDRQQLHDILVARWCVGIDTVNWKLYRSAFADEVDVTMPDPASAGASLSKSWSTEHWVEFVRQIEGFDASQHYLSNFIYDIDGDTALVKTYLAAEHHLDGDYFTLGGQSTHTFERTPDGWKVVKVALIPWWTKGNKLLIAKAAERYLSNQAPRSTMAVTQSLP